MRYSLGWIPGIPWGRQKEKRERKALWYLFLYRHYYHHEGPTLMTSSKPNVWIRVLQRNRTNSLPLSSFFICPNQMDKATFRGKIPFSYYLASGRWKFSRMAQFCLNSRCQHQGCRRIYQVSVPSCAKEGRLYITITYVEIFNGTNESLLLTFVMFFNKFAI